MSHKNLCTDVYSSFIHNCKNLRKTRCPSVSEWLNKLWYIQTMPFYSANKRKEKKMAYGIMKRHILSERSQYEKLYLPTI